MAIVSCVHYLIKFVFCFFLDENSMCCKLCHREDAVNIATPSNNAKGVRGTRDTVNREIFLVKTFSLVRKLNARK